MELDTEHILIGLLALTVVASGCLNAFDGYEDEEVTPSLDDVEDQEAPEEAEEETETEAETEESEQETNGEEQTETEEAETEAEEEEVRTVEITGFGDNSYDVDEVNVEEGETVEFVYVHEAGEHDLVLERDGEDVESTEVYSEAGEEESFTYTFEEEGDYEFYCSVGSHRAQGMEGTINFE